MKKLHPSKILQMNSKKKPPVVSPGVYVKEYDVTEIAPNHASLQGLTGGAAKISVFGTPHPGGPSFLDKLVQVQPLTAKTGGIFYLDLNDTYKKKSEYLALMIKKCENMIASALSGYVDQPADSVTLAVPGQAEIKRVVSLGAVFSRVT